MEDPWALLRRLRLGREEFCQRLLTMLVLEDAYPRWNTRSPLSEEGRAFLAALDRLSFGEGADLTEALFVDEFDLPARAKDPCGAAPDYAVLTTDRLWLVELKTERSSHRSDQVQTYVELARHHHPELRVDLTYLTGPGFDAPYDPPAGSRYAHVRWSEALPLLAEAWPDPTEEQRLVIETLHDVLGALATPWRDWRARRLSIPVEPEWDERDPEQEALALARLTAEDRAPRALDFEATDLEQLKELRVDVAELIKQDRSSALGHVRPWIWNAASTDGKPLTEAGATVGFELRLSWYKSPKRPTAGTS
jgi:hypothetical protein